jgi:sulfatase maturation enzyme AslB (radical SAM superfamily)
MVDEFYVVFYGGEPLLAFSLLKGIVDFLNTSSRTLNKTPRFSITTNGSILDDEVIEFLGKHRFSVVLSFDSLAQCIHRESGSCQSIQSNLLKLVACSGVDVEVNSVFTPKSIALFSQSIQFLLDLGTPKIRYSLSNIEAWNTEALKCLERE